MRNIFIFTILVSLLSSPSWSESIEDWVERDGPFYKSLLILYLWVRYLYKNGLFKKGERWRVRRDKGIMMILETKVTKILEK